MLSKEVAELTAELKSTKVTVVNTAKYGEGLDKVSEEKVYRDQMLGKGTAPKTDPTDKGQKVGNREPTPRSRRSKYSFKGIFLCCQPSQPRNFLALL